MAFGNFKKTEIKPTEDEDRISMKDLVGEIVAFDLVAYEASFEGKFGMTPRATVNIVVTTGEYKGTVEKGKYVSGNLARQLSEVLEPGEGGVMIVATGASGKGNNWIGIETVSDKQFEKAAKYAAKKA